MDGRSPRWPKSSGVVTSPAPNTQCQTRLTYTRAVRGLSALATNSASSRRPLEGPGARSGLAKICR